MRRLTAPLIATPLFLFAALAIWLQLRSSLPFSGNGPVEFAETSLDWLLTLIVTMVTAVKWNSESKIPLQWLFLTIAGWAWLAADLTLLNDGHLPKIVPDDTVTLAALALTILVVLPALAGKRLLSSSKFLFGLGLVLQSVAFVADLGDGSTFQFPGAGDLLMSALDRSFQTLGLAAYVGGLILIAVPLLFANPGAAGRRLWQFLHSTPGRMAAIVWEEIGFGIWRLRHPGAPFADYYAYNIQRKLDQGTPHRTLGQHAWSSAAATFNQGDRVERFASEGVQTFNDIVALRPRSGGSVVDYGCGSLRIGQHFIKLLEPGEYWGFDITDRFFNDGLAMLPKDLLAAKTPKLHVIGKESLASAAAAKPGLVYSVAVMKHVPREELDAYWSNILGLLQPHSVAVVYFDVAGKETRTAAMNWAYTEAQVRGLIGRIKPGMPVRFEILGAASSFAGIPFRQARVITGS